MNGKTPHPTAHHIVDGTEYSTNNVLDSARSDDSTSSSHQQNIALSPPRERKIPAAVKTLVDTYFLPHAKGYFQTESPLLLLKNTSAHCMANLAGKYK